MSIKLMTLVWDKAKAEGTKLLLLLALADMSNDEGYCWPAYRTLAKKIRVSVTHTKGLMAELVEQGLVRKEARYNKDDPTSQTSNGYWLIIGEGSSADYPPSQPQMTPPVNYRLPPGSSPVNPNHQLTLIEPSIESQDSNLPPADPKPKKQKPAGKQSEYPTMPVMFGKLAGLCRLDPKLMAPRIGKAAKELLKAGYSPEDLDKFSAWWAAEDWRGKKGQAPTIEQVKANIQRVKEQPEQAEAIDQWSDYPADYAISTDDQFNGSLDPSRARGRR